MAIKATAFSWGAEFSHNPVLVTISETFVSTKDDFFNTIHHVSLEQSRLTEKGAVSCSIAASLQRIQEHSSGEGWLREGKR